MMECRFTLSRMVPLVGALLAATLTASSAFASDALAFAEPDAWAVGDVFSTYHGWDFFVASAGNVPDVGAVTNPPLAAEAVATTLAPGFLSSSNNFYAFASDYTVAAEVPNHGDAAPPGAGTLVRVQAAATVNPDFGDGVRVDGVGLLTPAGRPIAGGEPQALCRATLLYSGPSVIGGPFGDVTQDEWLFDYWLPGYVDDFVVELDSRIHASFLALRVDTLNAVAPFCTAFDLNQDCRRDQGDALALLANVAGADVPEPPPSGDAQTFACADQDADGDVDLRDVAAFQVGFQN